MNEKEPTEAAILSLIIRLVVFLLYSYHMYKSYKLFINYRDWRSLRTLVIAVMIIMAVIALLGSSATRVGILPVGVALVVGYMAFGALLFTGLFLVYAWWRSDSEVEK